MEQGFTYGLEIVPTGGWSLVGIPDDRTVWTVNSSQFIREKMVGSEAFYSLSVGFDQDALMFTLLVRNEFISNTNTTD